MSFIAGLSRSVVALSGFSDNEWMDGRMDGWTDGINTDWTG